MAEDGGIIPVWGDGTAIRAYTYVDDLVDGVYMLMQSDLEGPTIIGSDEYVTVDFALAFVVLLGMMLYFGILPTWNVVWLPLLLLLALVTSLGVGLWLTAMKCDVACSSAMCATRRLSWCMPVLSLPKGLDVCHAHRLSQQSTRRALAHLVWHQSHGRCS